MKTIVIYHRADFDGIFCREIARKFLPDAELIGWDYGDPIPNLYPDSGPVDPVQLYMLDISVEGLMNHPKLIWIDHHKSAMEKFGNTIAGYRIDGVAACRLAWQWFTIVDGNTPRTGAAIGIPIRPAGVLPMIQDYKQREVNEPLAVRLAGEYDIWDKRDPRAELFQHGLRSRDLEPWWHAMLADEGKSSISEIEELMNAGKKFSLLPNGNVKMPGLGDRVVENLLRRGEAIQYATIHQNESIIKAAGFDLEFEGLKFLACNHARYNSHLFTAGLRPDHDACFGFCWRDGKWTVSLYHAPGKEHHDLSLIAVKYGGGGHRGACGFRADTLPFLP